MIQPGWIGCRSWVARSLQWLALRRVVRSPFPASLCRVPVLVTSPPCPSLTFVLASEFRNCHPESAFGRILAGRSSSVFNEVCFLEVASILFSASQLVTNRDLSWGRERSNLRVDSFSVRLPRSGVLDRAAGICPKINPWLVLLTVIRLTGVVGGAFFLAPVLFLSRPWTLL